MTEQEIQELMERENELIDMVKKYDSRHAVEPRGHTNKETNSQVCTRINIPYRRSHMK